MHGTVHEYMQHGPSLSRSLPSAGRYYCRPMWHSCACAHDPVYPKFCLNPLNLWVSGPHKKNCSLRFPAIPANTNFKLLAAE